MPDIDEDVHAAFEALRAADPSRTEMWAMLTYLCGYAPDGINGALKMIAEARGA